MKIGLATLLAAQLGSSETRIKYGEANEMEEVTLVRVTGTSKAIVQREKKT